MARWIEGSPGIFTLRSRERVNGYAERAEYGPEGEKIVVRFPKYLFSEDLPKRESIDDALREVNRVVDPWIVKVEDAEERIFREMKFRHDKILNLKREYFRGEIPTREYTSLLKDLEGEIDDLRKEWEWLADTEAELDHLTDIVANRVAWLYPGEARVYIPARELPRYESGGEELIDRGILKPKKEEKGIFDLGILDRD